MDKYAATTTNITTTTTTECTHTHTHTHRRPPARKHVPLAASSSSKTSFSAFACKLCCCSMIQDMLPPSIPSSSTAARTRPISARSGTGTRLHCILRDADTHGLGQYGAPRQHAGFCPHDILRYRYYLFHADKVYCFLSPPSFVVAWWDTDRDIFRRRALYMQTDRNTIFIDGQIECA